MLSTKRLTAMAAASITLIVGASCVRKPATTPPGEPSPGLDREAASDLGFTRDVLEKIGQCWVSLWTPRAAYAHHQRHIAYDRGASRRSQRRRAHGRVRKP